MMTTSAQLPRLRPIAMGLMRLMEAMNLPPGAVVSDDYISYDLRVCGFGRCSAAPTVFASLVVAAMLEVMVTACNA